MSTPERGIITLLRRINNVSLRDLEVEGYIPLICGQNRVGTLSPGMYDDLEICYERKKAYLSKSVITCFKDTKFPLKILK